jgi:hypothetical protein
MPETTQTVFIGWHGTSMAIRDEIRKAGFRQSMNGRVGPGVYLWHASVYGIDLATGWARRKYGYEAKVCAIKCRLRCAEEEILDLEDQELSDRLAALVYRRGLNASSPREKLLAVLTSYVTFLEKTLSVKFRVIRKKVAPPGEDYVTYPVEILGAPLAYIVRDVSIIEIDWEGSK